MQKLQLQGKLALIVYFVVMIDQGVRDLIDTWMWTTVLS